MVLTADQERRFLEACDAWQFPLLLTFLLTGMRPGELTHLLLPDDLDLEGGWLRVRNKPQLGWQVKTRNERDIPIVPELVEVLRATLGDRTSGPLFRQRRFSGSQEPPLAGLGAAALQRELVRRGRRQEPGNDPCFTAIRSDTVPVRPLEFQQVGQGAEFFGNVAIRDWHEQSLILVAVSHQPQNGGRRAASKRR